MCGNSLAPDRADLLLDPRDRPGRPAAGGEPARAPGRRDHRAGLQRHQGPRHGLGAPARRRDHAAGVAAAACRARLLTYSRTVTPRLGRERIRAGPGLTWRVSCGWM